MPKDACYHKVKARYRVFPSAYASGAIAKCRKVGAANYGTGGKKKKAKKKAEGGVVKMQNGGVAQTQKKINDTRKQAIEAYKNPNTRLSKNLTMHIERFKVRKKENVPKMKNGGNVSKGKVKRPSKNPNIARGCGVVMSNRRKITKFR